MKILLSNTQWIVLDHFQITPRPKHRYLSSGRTGTVKTANLHHMNIFSINVKILSHKNSIRIQCPEIQSGSPEVLAQFSN